MPTYMLEGSTPVALSPRPLTVTLQMQGPVAGTIQATADGVPVANAVRPRPELLILPSVEGRIRLHVEPVGAPVFAQGSRAHVSVGVNDPGTVDPERAVLPPIDLAGLARQDVLSLERTPDGLRVRSEVRETVHLTLGPLADAARVAATEIVGTQRLDSSRAVEVTVAVDASASFRRAHASGQLRRALDLLEGVSAVVDPDRRPTVVVAGRPSLVVAPSEGESVADAVAREFDASTPMTGAAFTDRSPAASGSGGGRSVRYVLTDAVPAQPRVLRDAYPSVRLVVVGHGSAWPLQDTDGLPATLVDVDALGPAPAAGAGDPLASAPHLVRPLVASLIDALGDGADRP